MAPPAERFVTPSAAGFALSLVVPSAAVAHKYAGVAGMTVYVVLASLALLALHRRYFSRLVSTLTGGQAIALAAGLVLALTVLFLVGYPIANSGLVGAGSDRDDALNIATTELLEGRFPYYQRTYHGNPISPLPGALVLAIPFVWLGNSAYQNLFWLVALMATVSRLLNDPRPAVILLVIIFALSPAVLNEFVTGGDLLANAIYVLLFLVWSTSAAADARASPWTKGILAAGLGLALASRGHFALLLPLACAAVVQRIGMRAAIPYAALVCVAFTLATVPLYLYDPAGFSPLHTASFAPLPVLGASALLAVIYATRPRNDDLHVLLARCAVVLAFPVVASAVTTLSAPGSDTGLTLWVLSYNLSGLFFAAVAVMPRTANGWPTPCQRNGNTLALVNATPSRRPTS